MVRVLVVDDSPLDRRLSGSLLKKRAGMEPMYAENGVEALQVIARSAPEIVLTDLQMPEMDGLELVEAIRREHPYLPVILMTAHGSEEIAVQALRRGAASYVPKRNLAAELVSTIENVLAVARLDRREQQLLACLVATESQFELDNDVAKVPALVGHIEQSLGRMRLCDETGRIQVAVAMREALVNAIVHGNLEVSSSLLDEDASAFSALVEQRRRERPYRDRRVHVVARETRTEAIYVVRDEGPGFDPRGLPDPTDLANLEKPSGRGLMLIRTFMDEVRHNEKGNEIRMVMRCRAEASDGGLEGSGG
ncbi:transcriptional regulator [Sorangium cellulosum]|uniref:Transcriptional regulator n=1 Tax=Sorangium cellulosum TaxID=56 RepID=A0A4P2Q9V2_SORCE|nr:response regulator [Sorangium cellulosum]AUX26404.1 transcriptional regulator [Sorangium cellulosum]